MKTLTHIHTQVAKDFIEGSCIPCVETIIYMDKGLLTLHAKESLELIQSDIYFKFSNN